MVLANFPPHCFTPTYPTNQQGQPGPRTPSRTSTNSLRRVGRRFSHQVQPALLIQRDPAPLVAAACCRCKKAYCPQGVSAHRSVQLQPAATAHPLMLPPGYPFAPAATQPALSWPPNAAAAAHMLQVRPPGCARTQAHRHRDRRRGGLGILPAWHFVMRARFAGNAPWTLGVRPSAARSSLLACA